MQRRDVIKSLGFLPVITWSDFNINGMNPDYVKKSRAEEVSITANKTMPSLMVLGDSISIHYGPWLEKFIQNQFNYSRKRKETINGVEFSENGGNSGQLLNYVRVKVSDPDFDPEIVLLNCGLHDIKRALPASEYQVPLNQYKNNLSEIFELLQEKNIRVIWVRTTPVVDLIHNSRRNDFRRFASDLEQYNLVADHLCMAQKIPTVDLHQYTSSLDEDPSTKYIDNIHFNDNIRQMQASYIAGYLHHYYQTVKTVFHSKR